jgi:hypothetical protein
MFCRFGSVEESRPVAATVWLKVVWIRLSSPTDLIRPSTVPRSLLTSRCRRSATERAALPIVDSPVQQRLQRVGVRGEPAGLGLLQPLRRQAELLEQHLLQLLGRTEVELRWPAAECASSMACFISAANMPSSSPR